MQRPRITGVGARLTLWIIVVFAVTLVVFVALDVYHEARFADRLGAGQQERTTLIVTTVILHTVHGGVTILAFGGIIHLIVRRLLTRRIARIVLAVQHFRLGFWRVRIPTRVRDEIEWLTDAFRELGPDLERKLMTYVEVDRKAVVARLGSLYERSLEPPTRRIIAAARNGSMSEGSERSWREVEQDAARILAELGNLAQPDHPAMADIVKVERSEAIVTQDLPGNHWSQGPRAAGDVACLKQKRHGQARTGCSGSAKGA